MAEAGDWDGTHRALDRRGARSASFAGGCEYPAGKYRHALARRPLRFPRPPGPRPGRAHRRPRSHALIAPLFRRRAEKFLGMERAVGRVFVLEVNEGVALLRVIRDAARQFLSGRRHVFRFAQAQIEEIRGPDLRRFQFLAFREAKRGIRAAQQRERFFNEPGSVPEFEGDAKALWQSRQKAFEPRRIAFEIWRQLEKHRAELSRRP